MRRLKFRSAASSVCWRWSLRGRTKHASKGPAARNLNNRSSKLSLKRTATESKAARSAGHGTARRAAGKGAPQLLCALLARDGLRVLALRVPLDDLAGLVVARGDHRLFLHVTLLSCATHPRARC